jgi:glutathione S-transferase
VADAYLFTVLGWADFVKLSLADWPVLGEYRARVAARPAVQQALREEGWSNKRNAAPPRGR